MKKRTSMQHSVARRFISVILMSLMVSVSFLGRGSTARAAEASLTVSVYPAIPDCEIIYDLGGFTYTVTGELAMTMMVTNEDGSYYIDPATGYYVCDSDKMRSFFSGLQTLYPTASTINMAGFQTTYGDYLSGYDGTFQLNGYIDVETEINYLALAIMQGRHETHTPSYHASGTYVEIDISNQILYYYENGILRFACSVVTGSVSASNDTPVGVYTILGKQRDIDLVGKGYVSHVDYWMNFIGNSYGLHDADWRSSFGGTIYLTNGSHGCVNIPPELMPQLYEMVAVGTPVVLY